MKPKQEQISGKFKLRNILIILVAIITTISFCGIVSDKSQYSVKEIARGEKDNFAVIDTITPEDQKNKSVKEQITDLKKDIKEDVSNIKDTVKEKATEVKDTVKEKATEVKDTVKEKASEVKETVSNKLSDFEAKLNRRAWRTIRIHIIC